ncbi:MAG: radical SAM protein [Acidobacteriota bacterium]|nr:MAG: radical SAM protein [Acidobacteriota bacterium]
MSTVRVSDLIERAYDEVRPLNAQLELTYKCNLLCSFCYNAPKQLRELSGEQWIAALDKLQAAGVFTVTLTGGEPMCHREYFDIAQAVRDRALVLKTYTNGVLLADRETAERYAALAPFDTEISLHGADAATHDRLTGIGGSFDKLLIALGHLSDLGLKVTLKTPITRLNQAQLREIEQLGARLGYRVTFDTNITPTDDGDLSPLSLAADREFMVEFFVDQVRRGARGLNPRPVTKMKQNCGTGRVGLTIDPYGQIFPCVAWRRPVANILDIDDLAALWRGPNETLDYVRKVAEEVPQTTLVKHEEAAFASFCPAVAEKETGDPYAFYEAARVSGLTRLEAQRRLEGGKTALRKSQGCRGKDTGCALEDDGVKDR